MNRGICFTVLLVFLVNLNAVGQGKNLNNQKIDGYRGIWFELGQPYEYGDKYSGGLGTYTAKHRPLAMYASEVDKTFFVFGGTPSQEQKYLLCMIGEYDHASGMVSKPTVVYDKKGVDDPHDNPSLLIDEKGYLWVFISGRSTRRMGFKYRSDKPYDINSFSKVTEEEMTYPQPWLTDKGEMLHLFTKYTGVRELYYESSTDGKSWTEDRKLAGIREKGHDKGGHYQVSARKGNLVATFMNRHPKGNVDRRTDLYYLQTNNLGKSWTSVDGRAMTVPLTKVESQGRVIDYYGQKKNVYLKDMCFDESGYPVCLYVASGGHEPGPVNSPREFRITRWDGLAWQTRVVCETDHNYDMGSIEIGKNEWTVIVPSQDGPQHYGTGGEVALWKSIDKGKNWKMVKQLTVNSPRNHSYMRRSEDAKDPFRFFWADGDPEKMSISKMYFSNSKGEVWQLPYDMKKSKEVPVKVD
ncbi:MAG: BNR-4 repeat-containing protein [Cyclobacteriaceae bacterium]